MGSRQIQPEDFGLSQQQFDEIKGVFDHFDTDASGRLLRLRRFGHTNSDFLAGAMHTQDVAAAMRKLGQLIEDEDEVLNMTIGTVDPDQSGAIGLNEFLVIMTQSHLGWGDQNNNMMGDNSDPYGDPGQHQMQQSQSNLPPELAAEDQAVQDFL